MSEIRGYHAHVYYNAETRRIAEALRETIIKSFNVKPGAFSDEPIGPHPISQFNVIFDTPEFQNLVPWLMLNRDGLDVLVHPLTDSSYNDHTALAMWLGAPVALKTANTKTAADPKSDQKSKTTPGRTATQTDATVLGTSSDNSATDSGGTTAAPASSQPSSDTGTTI